MPLWREPLRRIFKPERARTSTFSRATITFSNCATTLKTDEKLNAWMCEPGSRGDLQRLSGIIASSLRRFARGIAAPATCAAKKRTDIILKTGARSWWSKTGPVTSVMRTKQPSI